MEHQLVLSVSCTSHQECDFYLSGEVAPLNSTVTAATAHLLTLYTKERVELLGILQYNYY